MKYHLTYILNYSDGSEVTGASEFPIGYGGNLEDEIIEFLEDPLVTSMILTIVKTNPES